MVIGRLLAYISLCLMIMVMGAEGLRLLEDGDGGWISVYQVIDFIDAINGSSALPEINDGAERNVWDNIVAPMLNFSAFLAFLLLSAVLFFISRKKNY